MSRDELKKRRRTDYGYHLEYRTRWVDNDMYHHMNNNVYGFLFDSIINQYLIERCGRDPVTSDEIGIIVHTQFDFFGSVAFPGIVDACLRVNKLGRTSVEYELGLFERDAEDVRAIGLFTHVFVDRETNKPQPNGMSQEIRLGLEMICTKEASKL